MVVLRLAVVAWLLLGGFVSDTLAARPEVRDEARFFGPEAVRQANQAIAELKRQSGKDLVIETFPEPPADLAERMATENRDRVYADWARRRARDEGVNGIYVVITRKPAHLQVAVGDQTSRTFTTADRDRLRDTLLNAFRQGSYDKGLREAVDFAGRALAASGGARSPASPAPTSPRAAPAPERTPGGLGGYSWTTILFWGVLILGALFVLGRIMQNRAEARRYGQGGEGAPGTPGYGAGPTPGYGGGYPGYGGGGGGGGFGRGILGGLLGGMAGGYLYDRLRGGGQADAGTYGSGREAGPADVDYSSSGGDFDDAGGGGDSGGGGDFGGNDNG
jgi:uncharacterized membrane protein YgcG